VKSVYVNATVADIEREKIKVPNKENRGEYKKEIERYVIAMVVIASCQLSGINGIFYYAKQLFQDITGGDKLLSQKLMLGLSFCQVVSSIISGRFIDLFGRKYLLIRGQQTLIVILTLIFIVDNLDEYFSKNFIHYFIIFLLYLHVIAFNFSLGPVCIIYAAELVPNFSPIIITLRTFTFLVALTTNYLIHEFGIGQMFLMFGVLSSVAYYYLKDKLR
jgi:MFS family permease